MQFERKNKWYSVSPQGYCISAASVNGKFIFAAWPPASKTGKQKQPSAIKYSAIAKECYTACEQHYREHQKNQK